MSESLSPNLKAEAFIPVLYIKIIATRKLAKSRRKYRKHREQ